MSRPGPKPVRLPADAARELELVARSLDQQVKSWPKRFDGIRRGLSDAAASCRRRAGRLRLAQQRQVAKREARELRALRKVWVKPNMSEV